MSPFAGDGGVVVAVVDPEPVGPESCCHVSGVHSGTVSFATVVFVEIGASVASDGDAATSVKLLSPDQLTASLPKFISYRVAP